MRPAERWRSASGRTTLAGMPTTVTPGGRVDAMTTEFAPMRGAASDGDGPEDLRAGTDDDAVLQRGMTLAGRPRRAAEGDAVVERHVLADLGGLADDDAGAVIDEEPPSDAGAGMNIDVGQKAAEPTTAAGPESASRCATAGAPGDARSRRGCPDRSAGSRARYAPPGRASERRRRPPGSAATETDRPAARPPSDHKSARPRTRPWQTSYVVQSRAVVMSCAAAAPRLPRARTSNPSGIGGSRSTETCAGGMSMRTSSPGNEEMMMLARIGVEEGPHAADADRPDYPGF